MKWIVCKTDGHLRINLANVSKLKVISAEGTFGIASFYPNGDFNVICSCSDMEQINSVLRRIDSFLGSDTAVLDLRVDPNEKKPYIPSPPRGQRNPNRIKMPPPLIGGSNG